jgi:hypothetical protein
MGSFLEMSLINDGIAPSPKYLAGRIWHQGVVRRSASIIIAIIRVSFPADLFAQSAKLFRERAI